MSFDVHTEVKDLGLECMAFHVILEADAVARLNVILPAMSHDALCDLQALARNLADMCEPYIEHKRRELSEGGPAF